MNVNLNSDAALVKVRWESMNLDGYVRWNIDGVGTLMNVSQDLCGCELHILNLDVFEMVPG